MKRDARIGLAVVLVIGLTITLLVARSIHHNATKAGIGDEPSARPEAAAATATERQSTESPGATIDPAFDTQAQAVMDFQTSHTYSPGPSSDVRNAGPAGMGVDVAPTTGNSSTNQTGSARVTQAVVTPNAAGVLPALGGPPIPNAGQPPVAPASVLGTYTIASGDNPWKISAKVFGDGKYAQKIMDANTNLNPSKLRVGQKVNIPAIPNAKLKMRLENAANSTDSAAIAPIAPITQTLVADHIATPPAADHVANPPVGNTSHSNAGATAAVPAGQSQTHKVQAGETLGSIAASCLGSSGPKALKKLMDANPGVDARKLKVGQELKIPTP